MNQYEQVLKEDTDEYQKVKHGRVFELIRLNTDECLIQYGRVLKGDTDEYQRLNTDECLGMDTVEGLGK